MRSLFKSLFYLSLLILVFVPGCFGEKEQPHGTISGQITDVDTKLPLAGANIILTGTQFGASADADGNFTITHVPVGNYVAQCSYLGYEPIVITDIIVSSRRITTLQPELKVSAIETDAVTIRPTYFVQIEEQPTSASTMSREEIRRAAGTAGDVNRIIMALPSVAKVNDTRNNLIVRGGSPMENGFFVDNIAIPNINHFPAQGASSGALGLLNVDFIEDVRFYTGGFSAAYGDKLSSITDLTFREGNKDGFDGQLDINIMGIGAVAESPIDGETGSWMFSARRSYLDLIINTFDVEASTTPEYSDLQGKLVLNLSDRHRLTILDIAGFDRSVIKKERSEENKENVYGNEDWNANTLGMNWRFLWGGKGYSNTSITHNFTEWKGEWFETRTDTKLTEDESTEQQVWLRNTNHYIINSKTALDFGAESRFVGTQYNNYWAEYADPLGNTTPE
ncbi:TonB-dependent receptor, partial [bacterium]|nr:TonB-dependent receptor [bacterium]